MGEGDPCPLPSPLLFPQKPWQAPEPRAGPCGPCILVLWGQWDDTLIGKQAHLCRMPKWLQSVWCVEPRVRSPAARALPASGPPSRWRWHRAFLLSLCWLSTAFWENTPWRCLTRADVSSTWGKYFQHSVSQIFGFLAFLCCRRWAARPSQLRGGVQAARAPLPGLLEQGSLDPLQPWHLRPEPPANSWAQSLRGFVSCGWPAPSHPSSLYKHCWEKKHTLRGVQQSLDSFCCLSPRTSTSSRPWWNPGRNWNH